MEKIKKVFGNEKKIIYGIVGIAVVVLIIIFVGTSGGNKKEKGIDLEKRLNELGKIYYEKYYNLFSEDQRSDFLANYTSLGIKVDLENLATTVADSEGLPSKDELLKEFTKNGKACDKVKTKVTFYPQKPFGTKDYKMEINLDCGEKK